MKKGDGLGEKLLLGENCEVLDVTHRIPTGRNLQDSHREELTGFPQDSHKEEPTGFPQGGTYRIPKEKSPQDPTGKSPQVAQFYIFLALPTLGMPPGFFYGFVVFFT